MKVNAYENRLVFSTGKRVYANRGVIGITEPKDRFGNGRKEWSVTEGWDGGIVCDPEYEGDPTALTQGERVELANYMIGLWSRFKLCAEMALRKGGSK